MDEENTGVIQERLEKARNVIIASHVRPDGDAIGSLLGLGLALRDVGKSVQMVLVDGVPSSFKHLEGSELIVKEPTAEFDTFITVDSADFKRVGKPFENFGTCVFFINKFRSIGILVIRAGSGTIAVNEFSG